MPIFRDVETIEPGGDFLDAIGRALQSCGVLIAVIGPRWASITDDKGQRRFEDLNDYTRLEIATALKREGVRVILVLVDGASVPSGDALPADLQSLVRRNAIELSDKRWEYDVSLLVNTLRGVLAIPDPVPEPTPEPAPASMPPAEVRETRHRYWIVAAVVVLPAPALRRHPAAAPASASCGQATRRSRRNPSAQCHRRAPASGSCPWG